MTVVGTAGHVDHGKSTLLLALTGRDPDRWEEEKRRGLTIDLGFTWATLPSGREVSFVDVPGHERFIKNMLAGIEAVDVALVVVAADEGWMPQSEEHLAVLDLLDVRRGVVALTKVDLVDPDLLELATLEVLERLEGTSLADAPVVPVSARDGTGLDDLRTAIDRLTPEVAPASADPRLWVDRRFTVSGAGTVVTGTLLGGPVGVGDQLMTYPGAVRVRVRGVESHERKLDRVEPGRRAALSLVDAPANLARGWMLGEPDAWIPTDRFTARIRPARYVDEVNEKGAHHVHVGSVAVPGRVRHLGDGAAVIVLDRPIPLRHGDRFILRETGRRAVVGGGIVLDPAPPRRGDALRRAATLEPSKPHAAATALLAIRGIERRDRLVAQTGAEPDRGRLLGEWALSEEKLADLATRAEQETLAFHSTAPLRPGVPFATLHSRLGVPADVARAVIETTPALHTDGAVVWHRDHAPELTSEQEKAWDMTRSLLEEAGVAAPAVGTLPLDRETLHLLVRRGELVAVSPELVYLPPTARRLEEAIAAMPDEFTVADFRDALEISRKYAVPILEWADERGLTRRRGDVRVPRRGESAGD